MAHVFCLRDPVPIRLRARTQSAQLVRDMVRFSLSRFMNETAWAGINGQLSSIFFPQNRSIGTINELTQTNPRESL